MVTKHILESDVKTPETAFRMQCRLHVSFNPRDLQLDPQNFYFARAGTLPRMRPEHFELEILRPGEHTIEEHSLPAVKARRGTQFVAWWHDSVTSLQQAQLIFDAWSVGAVAKMTLVHYFDMYSILKGECEMDFKQYFKVMEERFHIARG